MSRIELGPADGGRTLSVAEGSTVELLLPENPTTGFRWRVEEMDARVLSLVDDAYADAPSPAVGAGRVRRFRFAAARAGTSTLRLESRREWAGESPGAQRFEVRLNVEGRPRPPEPPPAGGA